MIEAIFGDTTKAQVLSISHPFAVNLAHAVIIVFRQLEVDKLIAFPAVPPMSPASILTLALDTSDNTFQSMSLASL
jgi:hypothetical protein